MEKREYSMEFRHDEKSIKRLSIVQYLSFRKYLIVIQMIFGVGFTFTGLFIIKDTVATMLFLLFGCWLLISWKQLPLHGADKILAGLDGKYPLTKYRFTEDCIVLDINGIGSSLEYSAILRLSEDDRFDYLFISTEGAYMIRKQSDASEEATFKAFLSEKTGRRWCVVKGVFTVTMRQLLAEQRNK